MNRDKEADFYEEDEPAENIRAAFARGDKGVTKKRPRDLNQLAKSIVDDATATTGFVVGASAQMTITDCSFTGMIQASELPARVTVS